MSSAAAASPPTPITDASSTAPSALRATPLSDKDRVTTALIGTVGLSFYYAFAKMISNRDPAVFLATFITAFLGFSQFLLMSTAVHFFEEDRGSTGTRKQNAWNTRFFYLLLKFAFLAGNGALGFGTGLYLTRGLPPRTPPMDLSEVATTVLPPFFGALAVTGAIIPEAVDAIGRLRGKKEPIDPETYPLAGSIAKNTTGALTLAIINFLTTHDIDASIIFAIAFLLIESASLLPGPREAWQRLQGAFSGYARLESSAPSDSNDVPQHPVAAGTDTQNQNLFATI